MLTAGLLALVLALAPRALAVESGSLSPLAAPANCVGEKTAVSEGNACGTLITTGTSNAFEVQLSPDGKNAYSVSITGDLIEYSRNLATGALTVIGCVTAGTDECASENVTQGATEIADPSAIALSPDGKSAYVTSSSKNAIVEFERNEQTGLLTLMNAGKGCVTEEAAGECEVKEAKGLHEPYDLTVSPNGENLYATAVKGEDVAEFKRNTSTGALEPMIGNECIGSVTSGCPVTTAQTMPEPIGIVVSPDEKNVYVDAGAEKTEGAVFAFEREGGGVLKQLPGEEGCIGTTVGCAKSEVVQGSEDLAITPDGKNIYSTSANDDAIIEFERAGGLGALTQLAAPNGCVALEKTGPTTNCTTAKLIRDPRGLAVSPDGKNVYVGSAGESGVAEFARNGSGAIEQLAEPSTCLTSNTTGCGTNEVLGLKETRRVAVSPDGTNVYVAGQAAGAITEFGLITVPSVTRINPTHGSPGGGTEVYIKGAGFAEGDKVLFGTEEGTEVVVTSASTLRVKSPAPGKEETVAVRVENTAGISPEVPADAYSYTFKPTVLGVTPSVGSESGGTAVTITGTEFLAGSSVDFGGVAASSVTVESAGTIKATSPAGTGTVDVTVKTSEGVSAAGPADKFTYVHGAPTPAGGLVLAAYCTELGDRGVTLEKEEQVTGPGFAYENWACAKTNGEEDLIANTGASPSMAAACEAANPGATVYAYATDPTSAFSWGCYTIVPPATVTTVEPTEGSTAGVATVTIKGTNLDGSSEVTFGGAKATEVVVKSNTEVTAKTPAHGAGAVEVCVTATGGPGCKPAAYDYVAPPEVTLVEPSDGPEAGSTSVTVKGEHLTGATEVRFGATAANEVHVISATELTARSPAHASGTVDVVVLTIGGESARETADHFTYQAPEPTGQTPITGPISTPGFVAKTASVPAPVLAVSGNVAPVSGTVLVELPGSSQFVALTALRQIPFGSIVNATNGRVTVTAVGPHGELQLMTFFEGEFKLTQGRNGMVVAELAGGNFSVCPTARERAHIAAVSTKHASPKHVVRKLWAEGHGSYTTKGNYAAGAVLGTRWLTEDLCDGTLIHVATDKVAVTNLVNHRHKTIKAGHSYLAKAP
jgi:DNA-binding beta-propeller fold protein YncE